jgi:DNA repair exonuclease SbcCD ATPase subunit
MSIYDDYLQEAETHYMECVTENTKWKERERTFKENLENEIKQVEELEHSIEIKSQSILFLNEVGMFYEDNSIRREIERVIEDVLEGIYRQKGMRYKFVKKYVKNQHEISIYKVSTHDNGKEYLIPMTNTEGGGRDIVDIIIRMLILKTYPEYKRVLYLDEPMKNLDMILRDGFFVFFKTLAKNFNIQIIMNTHESEYIELLDNRIKLERTGYTTKVVK